MDDDEIDEGTVYQYLVELCQIREEYLQPPPTNAPAGGGTDTPQAPVIQGEPRLASFRKKVENANKTLEGEDTVKDRLSGYPNAHGILEAAHAAPRKLGYSNWKLNRSVEYTCGLPAGSLHYDTCQNGFMLMILIHRLYDNGYIMILPELDVLKQMADIASAIHQKLVQADLEKNRKLGKARSRKEKRLERANLKKRELALQAWIEAQWTEFDQQHGQSGTWYRLVATSDAETSVEARATLIPEIRETGSILAEYPWEDLSRFRLHVHPRFFLMDALFKKPCKTASKTIKAHLRTIKKVWTLPVPLAYDEKAHEAVQARIVELGGRLKVVQRPSQLMALPSQSSEDIEDDEDNNKMVED